MKSIASIFTSKVTKGLDVPKTDGGTITIRQLASKHLDKAAAIARQKRLVALREMGTKEFMKEYADLIPKDDKGPKAADPQTTPVPAPARAVTITDLLHDFDGATLMTLAVLDWSFTNDDGSPIARTDEAFEDLNTGTFEWLATEILQLAKPSLFQTAEQVEAARKNA